MAFDAFGIHIGALYIRYYGLILVTGAFLAAYLSAIEARRRGQNPELVWDAMMWVLVGGIVGARLWHVLTPPPSMIVMWGGDRWFYFKHILDLREGPLAVWNGGLGIPGGVIGGVLALLLFARPRKLVFPTWLDIAAPGLALAQAVGRWGNYVNQELYGRPTDVPWAITIDPRFRVFGFENFETFHPLFLYESLWNLGCALVLLWLARRPAGRLKPGDVFLSYLVLYPVGRFLLEFLRLDASRIGSLNANQTLMLVVALASAIALFVRHRQGTSFAGPQAA